MKRLEYVAWSMHEHRAGYALGARDHLCGGAVLGCRAVGGAPVSPPLADDRGTHTPGPWSTARDSQLVPDDKPDIPQASNERLTVLAGFIRNQVGLADRPPPGCIQLNNAEALLCAEALERSSGETSDEWQPIETAPRGVRVLTARRARNGTEWHIDAATFETYQSSTGWHLGGGFFGFSVSHWKSLTPPPSPVKTSAEPTKCGPGVPWDCLCGEPSCAYCGVRKTSSAQTGE